MVTITDIVQEYGKYYLNNGQNKSRLLAVPYVKGETLSTPGVRHIKTDETIYQMANPMFQKVLQQYQNAFTGKGGMDFHPNAIQLRHMKVDDSMYPNDIEESWLGFLAGDSSRSLEQWPLVRYLLEVYYAQQIEEDKELEAVYKGVYDEPTANTAGVPSKVFDGFHKLLQTGAADQDYPINTVSGIQALDADTAFDQIEAFSKGIASQYSKKNIVIFVAPEFERAYLEGKRNKGFYTIGKDGELTTRVDFTNHIVKGVPSMTGTTDIWGTVPENIIHLMKRNDKLTNIDIQKADRLVKVLMDWWEAVGFGVNKLVWASAETVAVPNNNETNIGENNNETNIGENNKD